MSNDIVLQNLQSGLLTITMNRPDRRNALNPDMTRGLVEAARRAAEDHEVRAVLLKGAGGTFCAGADLNALGGPAANRTEPSGDGPMGPTRMRLAKPVIAAISGHAVAGGLELALWCDLRVAEEDAVLGVFCRRFGVPLIDGGTVRLPKVVGLGRALDLILTGRPVPAPEALAMGLVNRVVPPGQAKAAAQELASEIAALPQDCLRSDRASTLAGAWLSKEEAMANEFRHGQQILASAALAEGVRRFRDGAGRGGAPL